MHKTCIIVFTVVLKLKGWTGILIPVQPVLVRPWNSPKKHVLMFVFSLNPKKIMQLSNMIYPINCLSQVT